MDTADPFAKDWQYPDTVDADVLPGWPTLGVEFATSDSMIQIGSIYIPERFELRVSDAGRDQRHVSLLMWINPQSKETELPAVVAHRIDVDAALDWLRRLRPIPWWLTKARLHLAIQSFEALEGRNVERIYDHEQELLSRFGISVDRAVFERQPTVRRRNRVTTALLSDVATIYRAALADGNPPTKAVSDAKNVPHSTAARYVGLARKAGLLPPTSPGKVVG